VHRQRKKDPALSPHGRFDACLMLQAESGEGPRYLERYLHLEKPATGKR
jgi:hypothetical protein